ncbi:HPr kinase/phosphorylase [Parerythrobacter jejuensis]|uniref:Serine kinase n=1 Tax=Parerythrobacter jejuensis TaxID=795812 RepID=A0A845AQH4_9SPHN|nr:HPr kinase/phosphatase C-terminal domain-containing protein [Parerythrobacter jejuensis]MXP31709.1 serine kinase [Parerythrobacter jejuensis]
MTTYQASCVAIDGRAVLIEGPSGSGKTSLALALIDRGAKLVGDDGVGLELRDGTLWVVPPPRITGMIEIRNVGIAEMEALSAPASLVLRLDPAAPRFVEQAGTTTLMKTDIPMLAFAAKDPVAPLRAEYALSLHGLKIAG